MYELVWGESGASIMGSEIATGDEFMFTFRSSDNKLRVRKFLNSIRTGVQPKVKVFPGSQFQALSSATLNGQAYIHHDIAPSDVSSNTISAWMWFFVAGAGSKVNIKFNTLETVNTDTEDLEHTDVFVNELLTALNANPEMLVAVDSDADYRPTGSFFLDLDSSGTKARKSDSTEVSALHALYGRPFIVSSIDSSDVWTNHGYVSGGRPYAHLRLHQIDVNSFIYRSRNPSEGIYSIDPDVVIDGVAPIVRPLGIPTPFDNTAKAAANTVSGSVIVRGTTFADLPTATQRRGYEIGIDSFEGLLKSGDPGDTLFATPPVETLRLWLPEIARTNPYYRRGTVASAGTVTYGDKDTDYFFAGGRGGCTSHFDFTTGKVGYPLPSGQTQPVHGTIIRTGPNLSLIHI